MVTAPLLLVNVPASGSMAPVVVFGRETNQVALDEAAAALSTGVMAEVSPVLVARWPAEESSSVALPVFHAAVQ